MQEQRVNQKSKSGLEGVFAAALTPMDEKLDPDHGAFVSHCRRLLDSGCHGLSIFGTTGEGNSLSFGEKVSAMEALVEGDIPGEKLLPGTGSCSLTDAVRLSRAALEIGAAGVLVLPPFYYKNADDDGLFRFFAELIDRVDDERLKIYLYHIPWMAGVGFSLPLVGRLIEAYPEIVVGTKDSSGDWERTERTCREFPGFTVFAGSERFLLDTLRAGGAGCISAMVNVNAPLARRVYEAYEAGEDAEAEALQEDLNEMRTATEGFPAIPALKALMCETTKEEGWNHIRPPLRSLEEDQQQKLLSRLDLSKIS